MSDLNFLLKRLISFLAVVSVVGCASTLTLPGDSSNRAPIRITQTPRGVLITSDERILFNTGESAITSDGQVYIERLSKILKEKAKGDVSVEGHTDNVGDLKYNMRLSEARAQSVKSALVKNGIVANRISAKGLGFSKPAADNNTENGRQLNRRTDILVLNETLESIGGVTAVDRLSEGFSNFVKDPVAAFKEAFGK